MAKQVRRFEFERTPGRVLVVGSRNYGTKPDWRKRHPDGFGVDMQDGDGVDLVHDLEASPLPEKFDHIECMSVLEHVQRPWILCENLQKMMNPGASIHVMVPFIWRFHGYPSDYWRITAKALPILFPLIEWEQVAYIYGDVARSKPMSSLKGQKHKGYPVHPRTEVAGFGRLCTKS